MYFSWISDDAGCIWAATLERAQSTVGSIDSVETFQIAASENEINRDALYSFLFKCLEKIEAGEPVIGRDTVPFMVPFLFQHVPNKIDAFTLAINHVDYAFWYYLRTKRSATYSRKLEPSAKNARSLAEDLHVVCRFDVGRQWVPESSEWLTELGLEKEPAKVGVLARAVDYYLYKVPDWIKLSDLCTIGDDLMSYFPDDYRRYLCEYLLENRHMGGQAGDRFTYMDHMRSGWMSEGTVKPGFFRSQDDFIRYRNDSRIGNTAHTITITPDMVKAIELETKWSAQQGIDKRAVTEALRVLDEYQVEYKQNPL